MKMQLGLILMISLISLSPVWAADAPAKKEPRKQSLTFEDELVENLKKVTTIHYIGHMYNDSFLDIYIYLDDPERANDYLKQEVNKAGVTRPFSYKIKKDPDWLTVQKLFR